MANVTLFYNNLVDSGTLSGGSWETALPLTNLQNRLVARVARSVDATTANTKFVIDLGSGSVKYKGLVLVNHNGSLDGQVRIKTASDSGITTDVVSSDWIDFYQPVYSTLSLEWEDDNWWSGTVELEDLQNYTRNYTYIFDNLQTNRYVQVEIDDTTNSDGYVEIGRLFISEAFTPSTNMSWGKNLSWNDESKIDTSLGGSIYFDEKVKYRSLAFNMDWLTDTEAYERVFEIQRIVGTTGEVFVFPDYENTGNSFRDSFLGVFKQLSGIEQFTYGYQKTSFSIREVK